MEKRIKSMLLSVLCLVLGTALFTGCDQSNGVDVSAERKANGVDVAVGRKVAGVGVSPNPIGVWQGNDYPGESFDIDDKIVGYYLGGKPVYEGYTKVFLPDKDDEDSGIVYLQYFESPYGTPGNFYAVRWEKLDIYSDPNTVWLSGCSDANGMPRLEDAMAEYTEANKSKYFAFGSDCHLISSEDDWVPIPEGPIEKPPYLKYLEEKTGIILFE